jgi:hypothetical protein
MAFAYTNEIGTGTDQELLDYCRAMIAKILNSGEAYTMDGRSMTRANLSELWRLENSLQARVAVVDMSGNDGTGGKVNYARRNPAN